MWTSNFTPEQMVHILRQGDSGVPVVELCRCTDLCRRVQQTTVVPAPKLTLRSS
jgi:hypothetical protein